MLIETELTKLKVGHYVVKIAKQNGNFTLSASGHIKNIAVINHLKSKQVFSVFIDESKSLLKDEKSTVASNSPRSKNEILAIEVKQAKEIFDKSKNIQKDLFNAALSGTTIELTPVVEITNKSIDAIFNSPDSLACMLNIREKDEYLLEHSVAVSVYVTLFARYLELDREIIEQLAVGAFLHDIGKIKVPDKILNKPGKLTDEEFTVMKSHANHSIDIIKKTPGISKLSLEVAALHHEKLDGEGYPFQVKGDDISRYGRMIAICDIFDALTANRVYKEGFPHGKAFAILRELAQQNHLDTILVDHFIRCVGVFPIGSLVQLESKKLALVKERNESDPTNPKVNSFYSVKLNNFLESQEIDLTASEDFIVKGVRAEEFNLNMDHIIEMLLMDG